MNNQGFSLRVNPLFLLIFFVFSLLGMFWEVLIAFVVVFFHELVHLIAASRVGFRPLKIEFFPFGGLAEYEGLLEMEPVQEIKVALAGPVFNLVVALLSFLLIKQAWLAEGMLVNHWIKYNLIIGTFNLLPALPLDGGRVIRALLVQKIGFKRGTLLAIKISRLLAIMGALLGGVVLLLNRSNIWFVFLAFFVYAAAGQEKKVLIFHLLSYLTQRENFVRQLKIKDIANHIVKDNLSLKEVIYYINPVYYNLFFVLDSHYNLAKILTETQLINSFFQQDKKELRISDLI